MDCLTKEAKKLLSLLYDQYKLRRADGVPIRKAKYFHDDVHIIELLHIDTPLDDLRMLCFQLARHGYLSICAHDNMADRIFLTDQAIAAMDNRASAIAENTASFLLSLLK